MKGTVRSELDGKPVTAYRQGRNRTERAGRLVAFVADTGDGLRADDPKA
ncbi:hypothetical protein ACIRBZ_11855 [Streptomyces sp. NPDC094038]